jgi:hypothetical protein
MDILGKLFGSSARVKIMRLFLLNSEDAFENSDIVEKSKVTASVVRKELSMLNKIGFISKRSFFKEVPARSKNSTRRSGAKVVSKPRKKRVSGWQLSRDFTLLQPIQELLVNTEPLGSKDIANRLKRCGNMKLIIVSGTFIQNPDSRVDMLIVGDKLKKGAIDSVLSVIESEVGKELSYTSLETPEFKYRLSVYDKFVRDILDYPHVKIVDKIGL